MKGKGLAKIKGIMALLLSGVIALGIHQPLCLQAEGTMEQSIYVSPTGGGQGDGSRENPYKTLEEARDHVRILKEDGMTEDITVYLRGGRYERHDPFELRKEDSGTSGFSVIYKAYENEEPIISGGKAITGWMPAKVNGYDVYKASVDLDHFRELYINNQRAVRASSVNGQSLKANGIVNAFGDVYAYNANGYHKVNGKEAGYVLNKSIFGQINNSLTEDDALYKGDLYRNGENFELVMRVNWRQHRIAADSITLSGSQLIYQVDQERMNWALTMDYPRGRPTTSTKFYVENAIGLLDYPGEWYHDAAANIVYYYPKAGEDMSKAKVYVPNGVETLVDLQGENLNDRVENIEFKGITFEHSAWLRPSEYGTPLVQANFYVTAPGQGSHTDGTNGTELTNGALQAESAIDVSFAKNITFRSNTIRHTGGTALRLYNGVEQVKILQNNIYDIAETGLLLGTWLHNFIDEENEQNIQDVLIRNNTLNGLGRAYFSSPSIALYYTDSVTIEHNEILHSSYGGVNYGWNGWQGNTGLGISGEMDSITSRNTVIRNNRFEDYSEFMGDIGGTYSLGQQPNSEIYGNYYKNGHNYNGIIYYDEGTAYVSAYNNVIDQGARPDHGISWHCSWTPSIHDYYVYDNYTNWTDSNIKGKRALIRGLKIEPNAGQGKGNWSTEAQAIIDNAGITTAEYTQPKSFNELDVAYNSNARWLTSSLELDNTTADYLAQYAVDGQDNNVAKASHKLNVLEIDLLHPYNVNKVKVTFEENNYATHYEILGSRDGIGFTTIISVENDKSLSEVALETTELRYIRLKPLTLKTNEMKIKRVEILKDHQAEEEPETPVYVEEPMRQGLVMWVDGESTQYEGNERVKRWQNKVGQEAWRVPVAFANLDAISNGDTNTRKKPQLIKKVIAGRPGLRFDGWDDSLTVELGGDKRNNTIAYLARSYDEQGLQLMVDDHKNWIVTSSNVIPGEWALWVYATENGQTKVYKNGELITTKTAPTGSFSSISISENRPIRDSGTGYKMMKGTMAELFVYNKGISSSEVQELLTYMYGKYPILGPKRITFTAENSTQLDVQVTDTQGYTRTPSEDGSYKLNPGKYDYEVSATGYLPKTGVFTVMPTESQKNITVDLEKGATLKFVTSQETEISDLEVIIEGFHKDSQGRLTVPVGTYQYVVESEGFVPVIGSLEVSSQDVVIGEKRIAMALTPSIIPVKSIDDRHEGIHYLNANTWIVDKGYNSDPKLYQGTRHHNYRVINQGQQTVDQSTIHYTFKGTGIAMYNEVERGVTNIEVNLYKGKTNSGELVNTKIANQRTLENGTPATSQAGNQKTYEHKGLDYGWYTLEIKPSIEDMNNNGMNGFITLDALKVYDERQGPVVDPTLISYWSLDQTVKNGGVLGTALSLHGNPSFSKEAGQQGGYGISLDGADDYLTAPVVTTTGDSLTMTFFARLAQVSGVQILVHNGDTAKNGYGFINYNGKMTILLGGQGFVTTQVSFVQDQWYHIAMVRRSDQWELYIDGVKEALMDSSLTYLAPEGNLTIGANNIESEFLQGAIDELRIYERALDPQEIEILHKNN